MTTRRTVVAVIDEDRVARQAAGRLLSGAGYGTELYGSADEYLSAAKSEATLLVVDLQLGDISGIELGRHLAATGFKFPIVFITASDDPLLREQAFEFGCVDVLPKSALPERLVDVVDKALASRLRRCS